MRRSTFELHGPQELNADSDISNCYIFITSDFTSHLEILSIDSLVLVFVHSLVLSTELYLTIIPRARMGSESIAHEVEGQMGY